MAVTTTAHASRCLWSPLARATVSCAGLVHSLLSQWPAWGAHHLDPWLHSRWTCRGSCGLDLMHSPRPSTVNPSKHPALQRRFLLTPPAILMDIRPNLNSDCFQPRGSAFPYPLKAQHFPGSTGLAWLGKGDEGKY